MVIPATTPIVLAPVSTPQKSFDGVWIENIIIASTTPTNPPRIQARVAPYNTATNEVAPVSSWKTVIVEDASIAAVTDPNVATAGQALVTAIASQITIQNVFGS